MKTAFQTRTESGNSPLHNGSPTCPDFAELRPVPLPEADAADTVGTFMKTPLQTEQ